MIAREQALEKLRAHTTEAHLIQHARASEAVLRALARHLGHDEQLWGLTGLLHDIDYSQTATDHARHGLVAMELLGDDLPAEGLAAIRAHNGEMTGQIPATPLDFALRCGETVTGLVITAALVRPTRMEGMEPKSLKKKMKDKAFAASVCRETIRECDKLGLELDVFLALSIAALTEIAPDLGLAAGAAASDPARGLSAG